MKIPNLICELDNDFVYNPKTGYIRSISRKRTFYFRNCEHCGDEFFAMNLRMRFCGPACNMNSDSTKKKYEKVFSNFGSENFIKQSRKTKLEKYGDEVFVNPNKAKETKKEKYGDENYNNRVKCKQTCQEKYGVDNTFQLNEIKEKSKKTCIEKYGVEYTGSSKEVINKRTRSRLKSSFENILQEERIGNYKPLFTINDFDGVRVKRYPFECLKCGNIFDGTIDNGVKPRCLNCYPFLSGSSLAENEIYEFIKQYFPNAIHGDREILDRKEIDILIQEKNIGIEYDGLCYHSELNGEKDKNYHLNKTKLACDNGIQLIHIFEDEWLNKQEIVKSILKNKLGICERKIFARKCSIEIVKNYKQFLNDNHIQGEIGTNINIGLHYNDELVSMISIGKNRFNSKYEYEIYRFCNKLNTVVVGGFSRLLKYFIDNYKPSSIVTYADARWSTGELYKKNGFILSHLSKPDYSYVSKGNRLNRQKFQRKHLSKLLENFDESHTEWENMQLNGYDRIWDCGNYCYVMIFV